jgi:dienelactone hydrolase
MLSRPAPCGFLTLALLLATAPNAPMVRAAPAAPAAPAAGAEPTTFVTFSRPKANSSPKVPAPAPRPVIGGGAPPGPPDGTYTYALSRNGADKGSTTVTILRRDAAREIEVDEAGFLGEARAHVIASYRYDDLSVASYVATYQAPFLRTSPIGAVRRGNTDSDFYEQTTVRYRIDGSNALASVDGASRLPPIPPLPQTSGGSQAHPLARYVFDAPFMASVLLLPAFRRRSQATELAPVATAFDANAGALTAAIGRPQNAAPQSPKTPKTDEAMAVAGMVTLWFDRGNGIVSEAHFDALNIDARLVSYSRATHPAPFEPSPTPAAEPRFLAEPLKIDTDPKPLAAVVDLPRAGKGPTPIVILVPPGPSASRNFGGDGPSPMFVDLARAFTERGYAVLRYDTPGAGASNGSGRSISWDESLADAQAAIRSAADRDGVDPKRVFVAGYGSGADLALAASASADVDVAGAIALAPTVVSYRDCGRRARTRGRQQRVEVGRNAGGDGMREAGNGGTLDAAGDGTWLRSSYGHDPVTLAERSTVPLFVLHPGLPTCGETSEEVAAYDDRLQAANPRTTILVASDLSQFFGGRFDSDSVVDTEEFFPYRFDASTANAIADWLDGPKTAAPRTRGTAGTSGGPAGRALPPPPPAPESGAGLRHEAVPNRTPAPAAPAQPSPPSATPAVAPGQPALPETLGSPAPVATVTPAPTPT